jgi:steroid delta-isomerase-like uncharacterized protein
MMVTNSENTSIEAVAAINNRNMEKFFSCYTDDCIYEDLAVGKINHGKAELKAFYDELLVMAADVKMEEKLNIRAGDLVASEWVMSGTNTGDIPAIRATGKKFSIRGCSIIQLRDGKISRQSDYYNFVSLLQQLGVLPQNLSPNWFGKLMMRLMMKR